MSDSLSLPRIARLSATVAGQIAAGEVIERPASVVKELMENSLDAGAVRIDIDIERGGRQRIRIRDDGHGIHPDDMILALESHATSKLRQGDDLERIMSLGFRGEALASIAAVSRLRLTSRIAENDQGWCLERNGVSGGPDMCPAAHPVGTTVEITDLFQPAPARRKFLRSEKTEFLHILETVKRLALSRFDVAIRLRHNGRLVLSCPAAGPDPRYRIDSVIGSAFYHDCLPVDSRTGDMRLWGWLGRDKSWRSQSDRQYFYLNGRAVRDKGVNHAVRLALEDRIPTGRYPSYLLHMEMDCAAADVNVHPTKQEVRFKRPRDVHDFIYTALHAPVNAVPEQAPLTAIPAERLHAGRTNSFMYGPTLKDLAGLYGRVDQDPSGRDREGRRPLLGGVVACLYGRFILCERGDQLVMVDAAAARRFYLDYRFNKDRENQSIKPRPLLVPLVMTVAADELNGLTEHQSLLNSAGLRLEPAGPDSVMVRTIPALIEGVNIQALVRDLAAGLSAAAGGDAWDMMLSAFLKHGTGANLSGRSPEEPEQALRALEETDLPLLQENYPGIWQTLDPQDLGSLIQADAKRK